jgi:hypothetical protein
MQNIKTLASALLSGKLGVIFAVYGSLIPSSLLAVLTPEDVITRHPTIGRLCNSIANLVPMIARASELSVFPEVVKVYFTVMWVLVPFWLLVCFLLPSGRLWSIEKMVKARFFLLFFFPIFAPASIFFFLTYFGLDKPGTLPALIRITLTSKVGLAMLGPVPTICFVLLTYGAVLWVSRIPMLYLARK